MTPAPTVVKAAGAADLLRLVPALTGTPVANSLVLVLFGGKRTIGALRLDLPGTSERLVLKRFAAHAIGTACRADGLTGVLPVAYTPRTFAPSGRAPDVEVLRTVARRARQAGLDVKDALCVAADGWGSILDPALPRGGRPLGEIEPMVLDDAHPPRTMPEPADASERAQDRFLEQLAAWWTDPEGPGGLLHGVDLRRPGGAFGAAGKGAAAMERFRFGQDVGLLVELVERMLDPHDDGSDRPCPCRALLFAIASRPGLPGLLLAQFGFGQDLGRRLWDAANAGDPASTDALLLGRIFSGDHRRPDPDRLTRAIEVLSATWALAPEGTRADLDGALAWLHWACGGGTLAGRLAERALAEDPEQEMARIVLGWVSVGHLPAWAFSADPTADPFRLPAA